MIFSITNKLKEEKEQMSLFSRTGELLKAGAQAHAEWEIGVSKRIMGDRRRLFILGLLILPIIILGYAYAGDISGALPDSIGGKKAYSPSFFTLTIFLGSIAVGLCAGLITGCIGAGGGFIIAPALMSAGVRGILAVGTDLFHIFAKAIMGSVLHRKLGNISIALAVWFLVGSMGGATLGGYVNRTLYDANPILSDLFITLVYVVMLGFLSTYAISDYFKSRKPATAPQAKSKKGSESMTGLSIKLQSINLPPMIQFDQGVVPGGRRISAAFLVASGFLVGLAAALMGVGGGFLTFPIFVYVLGVSSATTVGTDIFQIVFTAGYAGLAQYAIYGFIFYTLAMGMLIGSLLGIQVGSLVTKVVEGATIRGFYALAVFAGFINRAFALPGKLGSMGYIKLSAEAGKTLDTVGNILFFLVIGAFAIWVFATFFKNIKTLKGEDHDYASGSPAHQEVR